MEKLKTEIHALFLKHGIDNLELSSEIDYLIINTTVGGLKESCLTPERVKTSVKCPLCEQNIRYSPTSLNKKLCGLLIKACKLNINGQEYFHVDRDLHVDNNMGGGLAKLRHWGLVEPEKNLKDSTKNISGSWRVTEKAMLFIGQEIALPKTIYLYNSKLMSMHREKIWIADAIGGFDIYKEMMDNAG